MAKKKKKSPTPNIDRYKKQGLDKSEIVAKLTGTKDNSGAAGKLSVGQLKRIGFSDSFIDKVKGTNLSKPKPAPKPSGGGSSSPKPPAKTPEELRYEQELASQKRSAFSLMQSLLKEYGLDTLAPKLQALVQGGITDQATLVLELQDTPEWKQRFSGNERLKSAGLPVLSVSEYLATERSYAQIMKNFGLPEGFYDDPSDFGSFIGNSVSAAELQERVAAYSDLANREDPAVKQQLAAMGMSDGDLLAFMMDPDRANPLIQKKYKTALIGAAARRTGITTSSLGYAEKLAGMGVTEEQAQAGYAVISENLEDVDRLGEIYGLDYDQGDFEAEVFEGSGEATRKRKRLASQERAAFSGSSGVTSGSLSQSTAGQY